MIYIEYIKILVSMPVCRPLLRIHVCMYTMLAFKDFECFESISFIPCSKLRKYPGKSPEYMYGRFRFIHNTFVCGCTMAGFIFANKRNHPNK